MNNKTNKSQIEGGIFIKAFTLVELIVVITILAILATIWFVSFSGYLAGTRDVNRISQLKSMSDALELYRTRKDLPIPDDKIDVQASGTTIAYQGYIWANVLETIEYTEKGLDPKDKNYFSYYLTKNKKHYQLMAFLEEANEDELANNSENLGVPFMGTLNATDYSWRFPKVQWKKLWILTDLDNNPIQEISAITGSWYLDIWDTWTDEYRANFSDTAFFIWTGSKLKYLENTANVWWMSKSCNTLLAKNESLRNKDGIYLLDPVWRDPFPVYCDMTNGRGWWTLIASQWPIAGATTIDDFWPITISNPWKMFSLEKIKTIPHYDFWVTQKKIANPTNDYKYSYNIWFKSTEKDTITNTSYEYFNRCKVSSIALSNDRMVFTMKEISDGTSCYRWYDYRLSSLQSSSKVSVWDPAINGDLIYWGDTRISDYEYYAFWIR